MPEQQVREYIFTCEHFIYLSTNFFFSLLCCILFFCPALIQEVFFKILFVVGISSNFNVPCSWATDWPVGLIGPRQSGKVYELTLFFLGPLLLHCLLPPHFIVTMYSSIRISLSMPFSLYLVYRSVSPLWSCYRPIPEEERLSLYNLYMASIRGSVSPLWSCYRPIPEEEAQSI